MALIAYFLFVAITFPFLFARDRLIGAVYALLFIYSAFAFFGYLYMPGASESLNAYFGYEVGQSGIYFTFGSMILLFAANMAIYRRSGHDLTVRPRGLRVTVAGNRHAPVLIWALLVIFLATTAINFDELSWYISEVEAVPLPMTLYLLFFKASVGLLVLVYVTIRLKLIDQYSRLTLPGILYLIVFLIASTKLGNRTDPAAVIVGILYFETARSKIRPRTILAGFVMILFAAMLLTILEMSRYTNSAAEMTLTERIIRNDYFAPAHVMLAAIAYNFVDAGEVIRSNSSNALILMEYPYLQKTVMDLFAPGVASRSSSYAFYVFTEGYIFMGRAGVIYNAVVVSALVKLWNMLGCTNDPRVNLLIRSIVATMAINIVRSQSSYFIKYLYMFFLPVMVVSIILVGLRLLPKNRASAT